jgi:hypothetical protein
VPSKCTYKLIIRQIENIDVINWNNRRILQGDVCCISPKGRKGTGGQRMPVWRVSGDQSRGAYETHSAKMRREANCAIITVRSSVLMKQPPQNTRRNALPVELIDGAFLMCHEHLAGALV